MFTLKKYLCVFLFLITCVGDKEADAQIFSLNTPLFDETPFFNTSIIKKNNIKLIVGKIATKKPNDIIRTRGLDEQFYFDINGNLVTQITTFFTPNNVKDSSAINYQYDAKNRLLTIRKSDNYGYYSNNFSYDEEGNVIAITYCRDENKLNKKNEFILDKQFVISSETYTYEKLTPYQLKKVVYNSNQKPYKQIMHYYDSLGYLVQTAEKYLLGNNKTTTIYHYDENGRLIEKSITIRQMGNTNSKKETYSYDEFGNILEINMFENEQHKTITQFLYDKNTYLLKAQLIKNVETELIKIIQYDYTFYEKMDPISFDTDSVGTAD
ncbi:MAG: hypothetical protein Kow0079_16180 [Vicingaceae bacterium]